MTTTPATQAVTPEDKWQAAWDALPDGMHAYARARQAGINALGQAHCLPGDVGKAEWLNLMPREIVARAALNEGCRDKTADDIRSGLHGDVKIRAEVAVKLIGLIQEECFAALTPSPLSDLQRLGQEYDEHPCRHCEQKDPHCSVCEGVGYLPNTVARKDTP